MMNIQGNITKGSTYKENKTLARKLIKLPSPNVSKH